MYPILGRYGPFFLYSFTVFLGLGVGAGIGLTAWIARRRGRNDWYDALLLSMVIGLLGARIGFVAAQADYFQMRPGEVWQIWRGGLNYHGALIAGTMGLWAWCRWRRQRFLALADLFAPALALTSVFAWLACWLEGCAFGRAAQIGLLTADLPDTLGIYAVRYQTQILGLIFSLIIFFLLSWMEYRSTTVGLFWLAILGLSLGRVIVAAMRGDTVPRFEGVRLDMIVDGSLALGSLLLLQYKRRPSAFPEEDR